MQYDDDAGCEACVTDLKTCFCLNVKFTLGFWSLPKEISGFYTDKPSSFSQRLVSKCVSQPCDNKKLLDRRLLEQVQRK